MLPSQSAVSPQAENDLGARLAEMRPHDLLAIIGADITKLVDVLPAGMPSLLRLDLSGVVGHVSVITRVLDDLATLALRTWPAWPEPRLQSWGRAASRQAATGRPPRFRNVAQETQLAELAAAAGAPILIFSIDPLREERAAPVIAALEWCIRHGTACVALLEETPPARPPWERILHGAVTVVSRPRPVIERLITIRPVDKALRGSMIEKRMRSALAADRELAGLFEDEVIIQLGPLCPTPRVDLLWREGKVVVELDGAEHERDTKYEADRHRDFELLVAGYLVLRLTNAEIALDLDRSLDKVRRVVKLRRPA